MSEQQAPAIRIHKVAKYFAPSSAQRSIKQAVVSLFSKQEKIAGYWALKNISFDVKEGEFFGIVGRNGSGKSTLLKMIAGVYAPTKGSIEVNGKLVPFIELGVGFNPELSGRDNVFLNGALLGFNRKEMNAMYDDIVAFAELEDHMDVKLKNFSSGMQVRLAFSIAIRAKSDILLLDEVLAVGDALFQKKCYDYFKQLKKDKKTVIFVSHDSNALLEYCDRGALIENGNVVTVDKIERVVNEYIDILNKQEDRQEEVIAPKEKSRWGTGDVRIKKAAAHSDKGTGIDFNDDDEFINIAVTYAAKTDITKPVYGLIISDQNDHRVFGSNTLLQKIETEDLKAGKEITLTWRIPNAFNTGTFIVKPAAADESGTTIYDWMENGAKFRVRKKLQSPGFINIKHKISVS